MKLHWLVIVFVLCLLPYLFYFARPGLVGVDTYANLLEVCVPGSWSANAGWLSVLHLFPCDEFLIKVIQFCSYCLVTVLICLLGLKQFGRDGWKLGVFAVGLCPLLFQISLNFEAQWFGFVVGLLGLVGYVVLSNNNILGKLCFLAVLIYSCILWQGCVLLFIGLALYEVWLLIIAIPIVLSSINFFIGYALNGSILSKYPIAEEMPIVGATPTILMWPFLDKVPKKWLLATLFLFIVGLIKVKYMFLAIPFLAMGLFVIDKSNKDLKILGRFDWPNLVLIALCCSIAFGFMAFNSYPNQDQMTLYQEGIQLAHDNNLLLYNDWETGWYLEYLGFKTEYKSSYPNPDYNSISNRFVAITRLDSNHICWTKKEIAPYKLQICN